MKRPGENDGWEYGSDDLVERLGLLDVIQTHTDSSEGDLTVPPMAPPGGPVKVQQGESGMHSEVTATDPPVDRVAEGHRRRVETLRRRYAMDPDLRRRIGDGVRRRRASKPRTILYTDFICECCQVKFTRRIGPRNVKAARIKFCSCACANRTNMAKPEFRRKVAEARMAARLARGGPTEGQQLSITRAHAALKAKREREREGR